MPVYLDWSIFRFANSKSRKNSYTGSHQRCLCYEPEAGPKQQQRHNTHIVTVSSQQKMKYIKTKQIWLFCTFTLGRLDGRKTILRRHFKALLELKAGIISLLNFYSQQLWMQFSLRPKIIYVCWKMGIY